MSLPSGPQQAALPPEPCASCGAPLAPDQRYCLQCGEVRSGAERTFASMVRSETEMRETEVVTSAPVGPGRWPSIAEALAGLACLLLAMGVGVVIGRSGGDSQPAPAAITVAGGPAPTAVATAFTSDWPSGKDGWTVALNVLPKASTQPDAIGAAKTAATSKGAPAVGALDADMYPSLTAGSYVVYSGVFDDTKAATTALASVEANFPDARVVRVGAAGSSPAAASGGESSRTPAQSKRAAKAGAADTKKEFERSKKVPKTVVIPGKPPPTDNKPPGGGGEPEEIG
ncbi:MAG: zinc ribbon domain-containing protein [Actinomycetota bacterium]|nr:zinc ribbon domain-containing protein [Actinomycetota bacterium]